MRITIDKNMTTLGQLPAVKEAVKEFRTTWGDKDVFDSVLQQLREVAELPWGLELVSMELEAFPQNNYWSDPEVHFQAHIIAKGWRTFATISCIFDEGINVDTSDIWSPDGKYYGKLYEVELYDMTKAIGRP